MFLACKWQWLTHLWNNICFHVAFCSHLRSQTCLGSDSFAAAPHSDWPSVSLILKPWNRQKPVNSPTCFQHTCTSPVHAVPLAPSGLWSLWWHLWFGKQLWRQWSSKCIFLHRSTGRLRQPCHFEALPILCNDNMHLKVCRNTRRMYSFWSKNEMYCLTALLKRHDLRLFCQFLITFDHLHLK